MSRATVAARFWRHVCPEPNSGCWLWDGVVNHRGYALMSADNKLKKASHIALRLVGRALDVGQIACHRCDMPACVNPDHIYAGTHATNAADRQNRGRGIQPKGSLSPVAKLTEQDVMRMRAAYRAGRSQGSLAREYGLNQGTVSNICRGLRWAHVPMGEAE
jgi:hypothetical protein